MSTFNQFNGTKVLITGHTGFKGSWLSIYLSFLGAEVHGFALDPQALKAMVQRIRRTEEGIGEFVSGPYESEKSAYHLARKSLTSLGKIEKGTLISHEMLTCKRPGTGYYPHEIDKVGGKTAMIDIEDDQTITPEMIM